VEFESDAKISLLDFVKLENYLGDLLGVKIDLVEKSALKPRIGKQILSEVVILIKRKVSDYMEDIIEAMT